MFQNLNKVSVGGWQAFVNRKSYLIKISNIKAHHELLNINKRFSCTTCQVFITLSLYTIGLGRDSENISC